LTGVFSGQLIGVDVGGTKVAVATLEDERLSDPVVQPTQAESAEDLLGEIIAAIESARGPSTVGVGVGVPSVVEFETGRVRSSINLHLADLDLRQLLAERLGLPVFVDNDATVAALDEAFDDGGEALVQNLVMFTVGTGIGGGLVLGGRVYRGATGAAAELGHTLIAADLAAGAPKPGRFPQPGSLESLAAGRELDRLAAKLAADNPSSQLGRRAASGDPIDGHDAVAAAKGGDPGSIELLRVLGERLGVGIANAINTFDPDVVAIGGGVSTAGDLLLRPATEAARRCILPGVGERTEIRLARHGEKAGVRGAALLAGLELGKSESVPSPSRSDQAA
jgi:glucokinase